MPTSTITSLQNPRIKAVVKLRDRKGRQQQGRTIVDGAREILLALQAGASLVELYACDELCRSSEAQAVVSRVLEENAELCRVTPMVFEKLAFGDRHDGVLAVIATRVRSLKELQLPANPLIAILDGIEKPGNLGAMLRSADAAGVHAIIVTGTGTDLDNPNTIRASIGTLFSLQIAEASASETLTWLRERKMKLFAARVDAARVYTEVELTEPTAIILGSEAEGLDKTWHAPDILPIKLPMRGRADSLNVSVTAAILFYEALRQRHTKR